ncbi:MAG: hypothetical protein ACXQTR_00875 [Candidatus Methanospirareceae archaeon]
MKTLHWDEHFSHERWLRTLAEIYDNPTRPEITNADLNLSGNGNLQNAINHLQEAWIDNPQDDLSIEHMLVVYRLEIAKIQFLQTIAASLETIAKVYDRQGGLG